MFLGPWVLFVCECVIVSSLYIKPAIGCQLLPNKPGMNHRIRFESYDVLYACLHASKDVFSHVTNVDISRHMRKYMTIYMTKLMTIVIGSNVELPKTTAFWPLYLNLDYHSKNLECHHLTFPGFSIELNPGLSFNKSGFSTTDKPGFWPIIQVYRWGTQINGI